MKNKSKLIALMITSALLSSFASGCSDNNSSNKTKKDLFDDDSQNSDILSSDNEYSDIIDNVDSSSESGQVYSQTIMIYMVGSDLESMHGAATLDLTEMEEAMPSTGDNNIVVCTGGASKWQNTLISEDEQTILHLEDGAFTVVDTVESANMGEAENLGNFISQCMEQYNTDLYSLILWDHGAGPILGYGLDENFNDIMTLPEMQSALESSVGQSGKKLEWIGFDACLMSSMEICNAFAPYANYMIASQETEPGWGWNYEFLSSLSQPDMDGAHLGKEIIDSYMAYGEEIFEMNPRSYADLTLSCLDLNKYQQAEDAFNSFFSETHKTLSTETFPLAVQKRGRVKEFGGFSSSFNYCLVDTVDLIDKLADDESAIEDDNVINAIENMIVYMRTNVENANGISICYPNNSDNEYSEICLKLDESIDFAEDYVKYLNDFYAIRNGETIASDWNVSGDEGYVYDIDVPDYDDDDYSDDNDNDDDDKDDKDTDIDEDNIYASVQSGKDICLQLTPQQKANFGSATYYILCKAKEGGFTDNMDDERIDDMYVFVHGGKNVKMDNDGVLHAYYSNNAVYMKDASGKLSDIPMVLIDNDSSSKEKRYMSSVVLTYAADDISDWDVNSANLQIIVDDAHPNGEIRSAVPIISDDEIQRASKQLLSLDDYTYMSVTGTCNYLTKDENGNLLPFFEWEKSGWLMGFEQSLTEEYSLEVTSIKNPENYVCMFVVTDSQGNISVSDLIPLK